MSIFQQRLQSALESGIQVVIQSSNEEWHGRVTQIDGNFIELLCTVGYDGRDNGKSVGKQQSWVIRLSSIDAIALPCEVWDAKRLAEIPTIVEGELL